MNGLFLQKRRPESQVSYMTAVAALTSPQQHSEYVIKVVQQASAFIGNRMKLDKVIPRSNGNATFFAINCLLMWLVEQINAVLTSFVQLQLSMFESVFC